MNFRNCRYACLLALLISVNAFCQTKLTVDQTDSLVAQWVAIEKQNSHLKNQWQNTKHLLLQRNSLLKQEKEQLTALTANHTQQLDGVEEERNKLLTLQTSVESHQAQLTQWLNHEFAIINNILSQLPPPLAKSWQEILSSLDENNLSKRLESLLSLYNKYHEFNHRVSTQQAAIIDENGQEKMVQLLFLGVARGWYLTLDGKKAVAGLATANGWHWQHNNPVSTSTVKNAFAMLSHKMEAQLITLPMSLTSPILKGQ